MPSSTPYVNAHFTVPSRSDGKPITIYVHCVGPEFEVSAMGVARKWDTSSVHSISDQGQEVRPWGAV